MEEFQLMKELNHTSTVRVYGFILHKGSLALVMEYATRGSLKRFIQKKSRPVQVSVSRYKILYLVPVSRYKILYLVPVSRYFFLKVS